MLLKDKKLTPVLFLQTIFRSVALKDIMSLCSIHENNRKTRRRKKPKTKQKQKYKIKINFIYDKKFMTTIVRLEK